MRLPLSSSLPSVTDSEDGEISKHLLLADTNAEFNRIALSQYDNDSDNSSTSSYSPEREPLRLINFHPEVRVRFIRPRSSTMRSSFSDIPGSFRCCDSPIGEDSKQLLRESSPQSDDEEFDRFYRTMQPVCGRSRGQSFEEATESPSVHTVSGGNRRRSVSCDDLFFQSIRE